MKLLTSGNPQHIKYFEGANYFDQQKYAKEEDIMTGNIIQAPNSGIVWGWKETYIC